MKKTETIDLAVAINDISMIKSDVKDIKEKLEAQYVKKEEFAIVRNIVYGLVGIILIAVIGALIKLVILP
jgi:hypothetical protein